MTTRSKGPQDDRVDPQHGGRRREAVPERDKGGSAAQEEDRAGAGRAGKDAADAERELPVEQYAAAVGASIEPHLLSGTGRVAGLITVGPDGAPSAVAGGPEYRVLSGSSLNP
jgi:hypothetical protein